MGLGVLIDKGEVPFGRWSLMLYLVGGAGLVGIAEVAARAYRARRLRR